MTHTKPSEWLIAAILFISVCVLMSLLDDGYEERKHDAEVVKEAIKAAHLEAAENKRIEAALAAQGAYMTGFKMVQK